MFQKVLLLVKGNGCCSPDGTGKQARVPLHVLVLAAISETRAEAEIQFPSKQGKGKLPVDGEKRLVPTFSGRAFQLRSCDGSLSLLLHDQRLQQGLLFCSVCCHHAGDELQAGASLAWLACPHGRKEFEGVLTGEQARYWRQKTSGHGI